MSTVSRVNACVCCINKTFSDSFFFFPKEFLHTHLCVNVTIDKSIYFFKTKNEKKKKRKKKKTHFEETANTLHSRHSARDSIITIFHANTFDRIRFIPFAGDGSIGAEGRGWRGCPTKRGGKLFDVFSPLVYSFTSWYLALHRG